MSRIKSSYSDSPTQNDNYGRNHRNSGILYKVGGMVLTLMCMVDLGACQAKVARNHCGLELLWLLDPLAILTWYKVNVAPHR